MLRKRLQTNLIIFVLTAVLSLAFVQPAQANFTSIPLITVSADPEFTNWYPNKNKGIWYTLTLNNLGSVNINSVTSGFYTQSNVFIEGYSSWTGVDINIGSEADWVENVVLPQEVVDNAYALGEYAILYKSTFEGTSLSTWESFSAEAAMLVFLPPAPFNKTSPINLSLSQPTDSILNWDSSLGVYNSEYCIDTIKNFHCDTKWIGTYEFSKALSHLAPNTTYYWQVRALNYLGGITYADDGKWWSFKTKINYPILPAPHIPAPKSNFFTNLSTPILTWGMVSRAHSYEIVIALDSGFSQIIRNEFVTLPSFSVTPALSDGRYYWHVRTLNGNLQAGRFSKTQSFTIDTAGPTAPVLSLPADNASLIYTSTLKWFPVPTAYIYELQYDNNSDFSSPIFTAIVRNRFRRPPVMGVGTYYWHVRAKDAAGNWSLWSAPFTVTITGP